MPPPAAADKSALFAQYQILEELGDFPNYSLYKVKAPNGTIKLWKKVDLQFNAAGIETRLLPVIERVHHPYLNTVSNSFHFSDKGLLFVESEFPAKTLRHRLAECKTGGGVGGIPVQELLAYMQQAAEAIDFLNTAQHLYNGRKIAIYHRAVSPDSLQLFEEKGRVVCKVGDFGLAKPIVDTTDSARHSLGMTNFDYSPPEYDDGIISNTSDQFALATTYCELKTGKLPFTGSLLQKLQAQLAGTPDLKLMEANERPVLTRALTREPQARFPTCKEFVQQLQAALGGLTTFAVASSRVLGKQAANGAGEAAATTGWGGARPVGKSGGALFDVGATVGRSSTPAKPDGSSLLGGALGGNSAKSEVKLTTLEKDKKKERKDKFVPEPPKAREPVFSPPPVEERRSNKPVETRKREVTPLPETVDPASLPDSKWTPGQVTAQNRGPVVNPPGSEANVEPSASAKAGRPEISNKAKETLEILKKRHHQPSVAGPSSAGIEKPVAEASPFTSPTSTHSSVDPYGAQPPRRGSTDHIGDRLPFRPPPLPVPRRSSSPGAPAAANVTPFQALRTNVPEEKPQGTSVLMLFLIAFSAFCISMFVMVYFGMKK